MHLGCDLHPVSATFYMSGTILISVGQDNYPEPGKRPLSSTVPTIIEHPCGLYVAIGGSGHAGDSQTISQVRLNLDREFDVMRKRFFVIFFGEDMM